MSLVQRIELLEKNNTNPHIFSTVTHDSCLVTQCIVQLSQLCAEERRFLILAVSENTIKIYPPILPQDFMVTNVNMILIRNFVNVERVLWSRGVSSDNIENYFPFNISYLFSLEIFNKINIFQLHAGSYLKHGKIILRFTELQIRSLNQESASEINQSLRSVKRMTNLFSHSHLLSKHSIFHVIIDSEFEIFPREDQYKSFEELKLKLEYAQLHPTIEHSWA